MEKDKIEIIIYKPKNLAAGDMRGSSIMSALASQSPERYFHFFVCVSILELVKM